VRADGLTIAARSALFEIVATVRKLLAQEIGPIEAAELVTRLSRKIGTIDTEMFVPFIEIQSESDELVLRNPSLWAPAFVEELFMSRDEYEDRVRPRMPGYCESLLAVCVPLLSACPVCSFSGTVPPNDSVGEPSYETCRACGFFFDDGDTELDYARWRRQWIARGLPFSQPPAPSGWNAPRFD
jgi:hypothetical protein